MSTMFPTYVGMNRSAGYDELSNYDVPHIRGDEPVAFVFFVWADACSPHTWG